ncbi:hypothetical protein GCM10010193_16470 [Kitasatospora atroaurantiaca]|uniref:Uncharacterized protein n=1 Tax=Kitasatospora atroaurantiaca TaxID=285545 RepID=A0A561EXF2_9ACTN|nr:hypothetical protein [Kitasatospora atroaurantiaca]TWE20292.1 hypothetical protein FB465_5441 [Kitasatospora atroaurantiaca]
MVTLLVIQPILARLEEDRVREHLRLDYPSFCEKVAQAGDIVCVLDTFSYLFSGHTAERFADAARSAIGRGATLRIMLLDPDSLAAQQRSHELSADVRREIMRNLRDLRRLEAQLPRERRQQLEVRVYAAAPSIQLYRCGERMMVSFFPVDRLSGEGQQLEVRITTPLGSFVSERFAELWSSGRSINELLTTHVQLLEEESGENAGAPMRLEYVRYDGSMYVCDQRVVVELARRRDRPLRVRLDGRADQVFELEMIGAAEERLLQRISTAYSEKYGTDANAFVRLRPLRHGIIDTASSDLPLPRGGAEVGEGRGQ